MMATPEQINDLHDLRNYIERTLCQQNELELGVFPFTERILARAGRPCGIFFCLAGPRSVKFTAIWETERNSILFYGSSGERIAKTQLTLAPKLAVADAL
jgi:hypothetical protein